MSVQPRTSSADARLRVPERFRGPYPGWVNGGVIAGLLVAALPPGTVTTRIARPVPLDQPLDLVRSTPVSAELRIAGTTLAAGCLGELEPGDLPPAVTLAEARATIPAVAPAEHPAAGCFACGPSHPDGLDLQPGPVLSSPVLATVWTPDPSLAEGRNGLLPPHVVHAALDCPGWYAGLAGEPALLGSMTSRQHLPVRAGDVVVVTAWLLGTEGRKVRVGTALRSPDATLLAGAVSTWVVPRTAPPR